MGKCIFCLVNTEDICKVFRDKSTINLAVPIHASKYIHMVTLCKFIVTLILLFVVDFVQYKHLHPLLYPCEIVNEVNVFLKKKD